MKTKEELNELKEEYKVLKTKLKELSEDELKEVIGGLRLKDSSIFPINPVPKINCTDLDKEEAETKGYCEKAQYCPDKKCKFNQ